MVLTLKFHGKYNVRSHPFFTRTVRFTREGSVRSRQTHGRASDNMSARRALARAISGACASTRPAFSGASFRAWGSADEGAILGGGRAIEGLLAGAVTRDGEGGHDETLFSEMVTRRAAILIEDDRRNQGRFRSEIYENFAIGETFPSFSTPAHPLARRRPPSPPYFAVRRAKWLVRKRTSSATSRRQKN